MKKKKKKKVSRRKRSVCGLCGSKTNLTQTDCCGQWICDDADQYVPFSYANNSCCRNHDRYTLCAFHYHEGHSGDWKTCPDCKAAFADEMEMYVYLGTNEFNFEKLPDPPAFEPTYCSQCGKQIHLGIDGYSIHQGKYTCSACTNPLPKSVSDMPSELSNLINNMMDFDVDEDGLDHPERLGPDDLDDIPSALDESFRVIGNMIKGFCDERDAVEFGFICLDMLISLCVQFPDKIRRSKPESWGAGIVHAIGMVNFLSDPETEPYIESSEIYPWFKVAESTMQSKSRTIRAWFGTFEMDPTWSLPALILDNPLAWTLPIDGLLVDLRQAPETVQQRAVDEGLIPMTPAEFKQHVEENRKLFNRVKNVTPAALQSPDETETPNIKLADHLPDDGHSENLPLFDPPDGD